MALTDETYTHLLALRTGLRRFYRWSERQARAAGLTPAQHQLLLAIRGHTDPRGPTIGEAADYLLLRHHSAVGLVDRAEVAGLVTRTRDLDDHRVVRLALTEQGEQCLERLSTLNLEELERLALKLPDVWPEHPLRRGGPHAPLPRGDGAAGTVGGPVTVTVARLRDVPVEGWTRRILVDRQWPRGVPKAEAPFELWIKDVAPSAKLKSWYGDDPERFGEFARRYRTELGFGLGEVALRELREEADAGDGTTVLVTAASDLERSAAFVLQGVLAGS